MSTIETIGLNTESRLLHGARLAVYAAGLLAFDSYVLDRARHNVGPVVTNHTELTPEDCDSLWFVFGGYGCTHAPRLTRIIARQIGVNDMAHQVRFGPSNLDTETAAREARRIVRKYKPENVCVAAHSLGGRIAEKVMAQAGLLPSKVVCYEAPPSESAVGIPGITKLGRVPYRPGPAVKVPVELAHAAIRTRRSEPADFRFGPSRRFALQQLRLLGQVVDPDASSFREAEFTNFMSASPGNFRIVDAERCQEGWEPLVERNRQIYVLGGDHYNFATNENFEPLLQDVVRANRVESEWENLQ